MDTSKPSTNIKKPEATLILAALDITEKRDDRLRTILAEACRATIIRVGIEYHGQVGPGDLRAQAAVLKGVCEVVIQELEAK